MNKLTSVEELKRVTFEKEIRASKSLVTGAAGFIGLHLVSELINNNATVYALIENSDEVGKKKLFNISQNVRIIDSCEQMLKSPENYPDFDCIFHLATVGVNPAFNNIELFCDVNIKMACQLIDFAKINKTKLFVNFGSCFEYGDHGNVLLTENMDCRPESLYAISKNASTNLSTCYAKKQGVNLITVRPFGVFGEGEGNTRLAPSIIRSCLHNEVVKTTFGEQIRDFVNVKDVVKAVIALTEADYVPYEIYNICSDNPVSVRDFILEIVDTCNFDRSLIDFGGIQYRDNEAMVFAGNNKKLQGIINYPFPMDHKNGVIDIYNMIVEAELISRGGG